MKPIRRRLLAVIPLIAVQRVVYGEEQASLIAQQGVWQFPGLIAAPAPFAAGYQVALPVIVGMGAPAIVEFYGITGDVRSGPASSFAFGITALEYQVRIVGAAGQPYREEWSRDNTRQPQLDTQSSIPTDPAVFVNRIQLNTGGPLPRGNYRLRIFVSGLIGADVTVVVG